MGNCSAKKGVTVVYLRDTMNGPHYKLCEADIPKLLDMEIGGSIILRTENELEFTTAFEPENLVAEMKEGAFQFEPYRYYAIVVNTSDTGAALRLGGKVKSAATVDPRYISGFKVTGSGRFGCEPLKVERERLW